MKMRINHSNNDLRARNAAPQPQRGGVYERHAGYSAPEPEPEPEAVEVEVDSGAATPLTVAKITGHHVYGGARAGSLYNIYVRVLYSDGSKSNGMISAEPLAGTDALTAYLATGRGGRNFF